MWLKYLKIAVINNTFAIFCRLGFVPQTTIPSPFFVGWVSSLKRHVLQVGKPVGFRPSNATCYKSGNPPNAVPQTPRATSRETRPMQWLKRHVLQVGKPAQCSGSNATCYKSGNPPNAVAPTPRATSRETRPMQWLHNLRIETFFDLAKVLIKKSPLQIQKSI